MNTQAHTQTRTAVGLSEVIAEGAQILVDTWSAIRQTLRDRSQRRLDRMELEQLDGNALRDLGICRSEFDSYRAESIVSAELTRRRVAWPSRDGF